MTNELFKPSYKQTGEMTFSGRELYEFLEVTERYNKWFERMLQYGFTENVDFTSVKSFTVVNNGAKREIDNHELSLDMAKEIAMVQRNERGKQARQYFLELERRWNSPEMVMKRAMDYLNAQVEKLQTTNLMLEQELADTRPKANYVDVILKSKDLLTVTQIADDYGMSAKKFNQLLKDLKIQFKQSGQWFLYADLKGQGYTKSETHMYDKPNGEKGSNLTTKWTQKGRLYLYDRLKNEGILPTIEQESVE